MTAACVLVFGADFGNVVFMLIVAQQARRNADAARRIENMHGRAGIGGFDPHGGMNFRGRRTADQQRYVEAFAFHFRRDVDHFVERRRDQAAETDDIDLFLACGFQNFLRRHHDAEINDVVVVALKNDADDVLADIVHVALHRGEQDFSLGLVDVAFALVFFDERDQIGDCLLHHARALDHLRQKHFPRAEQIADDIHAVHQRAFDHLERTIGCKPRLFGVFQNEIGHAVDQRMGQPGADGRFAPGQILRLLLFLALEGFRGIDKPLGGIIAAIEDHVLDQLAEIGRDVVVQRQLTGIHDRHIHAGADGVIEEHRVHRLAHRIIAPERERDVAQPAGHHRVREVGLDPRRRPDEILCIVIVLLDPRRHGENVGIEDDVFRPEPGLVHQQIV